AAENEEAQALRRELLERIAKADPKNTEYVVALAELVEQDGDLDRCRKLLEPVQSELRHTEGARILGQILAGEGRLDEAHALLVPYTTSRLAQLHDAEAALDAAFEACQDREMTRLRMGSGPQSFYDAYEAADEQEQDRLLQERLLEAIKNDAPIAEARETMMERASIVPTALDLGIVLLRRAQAMPSPEERERELKQAEKTFLAIRGVAGETDEYRLFLGQVYYWLGKQDEGRALFDELLAANDRSFTTLAAVATVLRDLGDNAGARAAIEEAYDKTDDEDEKHQAARRRALMYESLDDEIKWLRLSDATSIENQASLATSLGHQAARDGDYTQAEAHYREGIAAIDKLPESASTLNNSALAYFALSRVSGDRTSFDEALRRVDRAVALSPSDSILLLNAVTMLMQAAAAEVIGDQIDFAAIKTSAAPTYLPYLYHTQAELNDYVQRLKDHQAMRKAIDYLGKALVLAPKETRVYGALAHYYDVTEDESAAAALLAKIDAAGPDVSDEVKRNRDIAAGVDLDRYLREQRENVIQYAEVVAARRTQRDRTFALAGSRLSDQKIGLAALGEAIDADEIVRLAEEAYECSTSSATQQDLIHALLFR
ncbi:MAG: hypothetical protein KDA41_14240, partial [Planctomycetales bacterium]|nr:hypothetical protein [Planctomycetales bacterium]